MAPQGGGQGSTEAGKGPTDITLDMVVGPQARAGEQESEDIVWQGSRPALLGKKAKLSLWMAATQGRVWRAWVLQGPWLPEGSTETRGSG